MSEKETQTRRRISNDYLYPQNIASHRWHRAFLGQSDEIPEALRIMALLWTPVLLVFLLMLYWLARVLFLQWKPRVNDAT